MSSSFLFYFSVYNVESGRNITQTKEINQSYVWEGAASTQRGQEKKSGGKKIILKKKKKRGGQAQDSYEERIPWNIARRAIIELLTPS